MWPLLRIKIYWGSVPFNCISILFWAFILILLEAGIIIISIDLSWWLQSRHNIGETSPPLKPDEWKKDKMSSRNQIFYGEVCVTQDITGFDIKGKDHSPDQILRNIYIKTYSDRLWQMTYDYYCATVEPILACHMSVLDRLEKGKWSQIWGFGPIM